MREWTDHCTAKALPELLWSFRYFNAYYTDDPPPWRGLILAGKPLRYHGILGQAAGAGFATGADPTGQNPYLLAGFFFGDAHLGGRTLRGLLESPVRVHRRRRLEACTTTGRLEACATGALHFRLFRARLVLRIGAV